jgi:7-cyano-7-deazaguanine synthase
MSDAVLLSGGMDSIALTVWVKPQIAITCNYGQLAAEGELRAAQKIASELGIAHEVIAVNCQSLGSGDLAGTPASPLAPMSEWWPFRNQLLVTFSAMAAIRLGVSRLLLGTVKNDGFHIDGTNPFVAAIDKLCNLQEGHIRIAAPAIGLTSVELVRSSGIDLNLLAWAHSCHVSPWACGRCRGCCKHRLVMQELGYEAY